MSAEHIIAACDGASKGNPGRAAWGWVSADAEGRPQRWEAGPLGTATNNIAELTALAELLEATDPAVRIEVRMDSQYAMNAVTKWLPGWKRNGWMTASKKPVANRELVERIDSLLSGRAVEFVYVPAHRADGDHLNAIADQAASDVAESQVAAGTSQGAQEFPVPRPASAQGQKTAKKTAGRPRSGGSRTIKAKFAGQCGGCGRSYEAGTQVAKGARSWGHPECREL
ncbi:ribonuclease H [Streptomyces sp. NPDC050610]|uniref:ribonuclease H family protein n=1 Tax=Streptomyces sp. NPDC050610 TaxID=3157097 RepID=UPI00343551D7